MNENPHVNGGALGAGTSVALGFVLGALVGAGVALLLAPRTGKETRHQLADAGRRLGDTARSKLGQARETISNLEQDAKAALEAGREAFVQGKRSNEAVPAPRAELKG